MECIQRTIVTAAGAAMLALVLSASPATAQTMMGPHPGMPGGPMMGAQEGMGMMGGMMGGMRDGMKGHRMGPHNAAVHFLQMADMLGLDDNQISRLRKLRDDWIAQHSVDAARLKAAEADLKRLLYADDIKMDEVEQALSTIGTLEGQLWRAFAEQLSQIKGMLSGKQKERLREKHRMMR